MQHHFLRATVRVGFLNTVFHNRRAERIVSSFFTSVLHMAEIVFFHRDEKKLFPREEKSFPGRER